MLNWLYWSFAAAATLSLASPAVLRQGCDEGEIQLVGVDQSDTLGRVEICRNGVFGTICDTDWDSRDATVVCSQLGLPTAGARSFPLGAGDHNQPIHYDRVNCTGSERTLSDCTFGTNVIDKCTHFNDAGVICTATVENGDFVAQSECGRSNLKCPNENRCLPKGNLCQNIRFYCRDVDEIQLSSSFGCRYDNTFILSFGRGERNLYQCKNSRKRIPYDTLCNGVDDCGNGDDELTDICANRCRPPFRGGCPQTRECINTDIGPLCGECRKGLVEDPNNPGGECVFSFTGGTPFLNGSSITIEFTANVPMESAICTFRSRSGDDNRIVYSRSCLADSPNDRFKHSSFGALTVSLSLSDFPITISVNANVRHRKNAGDKLIFTESAVVSTTVNAGSPGTCVVNLVDQGVTIIGGTAMLHFRPSMISADGSHVMPLSESDMMLFDHNCQRSDSSLCTCPCGYGPISYHTSHTLFPFYAHGFFFSRGSHSISVTAQSSLCDISDVTVISFMIH